MKAPSYFSLLFGLLLTGCGKEEPKPAQPTNTNTTTTSAGNPLTAPVDYLGAIGKAQQLAVKTVDTVAVGQAIQMFQVQEGRFPKDLNELVTKGYLRELPKTPYGTKLVYDANTGTAKVVKQ